MEATSRIPTPASGREPLKVNVFERMSKSSCSLLPMFPYEDAGSIIPCAIALWGGPDKKYGHYFHTNSVDEVCLTFGTNKATVDTAAIMVNQSFHGVNSFLRDEKDPEAFLVGTVTQRQSTDEGQKETIAVMCQKCKKELARVDFDAAPEGTPDHRGDQWGREDDVIPPFPTIAASVALVDLRNSDQGRICKNCGHVNDLFPEAVWHWRQTVDQTRVINASARTLKDAAAAVQR
jgi:hypothetical protein